MDDDKRLLELACQIGDQHSRRAIQLANEVHRLRGAIWKAIIHLRAGRTDVARRILEETTKEQEKK